MRVPVIRRAVAPGEMAPPRAHAGYLRDTRSHVISTRPAVLRESRDDIRRSWRQVAAITQDLIQNSGRLRGAADQVIADTVGIELGLNWQPDPAVMTRLGYGPKELADLIKLVKQRWKRWAWNPRECDLRGKFTVPQMVDIGLRWNMTFGEVTGLLVFLSKAERARYGIQSGTKVCMVPPLRLSQKTNAFEDLFQGIYHDPNGRPLRYVFDDRVQGVPKETIWPARDGLGNPVVMHIFDPLDATDVRGIGGFASAIRKHIQHERLDDVTLQTATLQTIFAATLTSDKLSGEAFEALEAMAETGAPGTALRDEFYGMFREQLNAAKESGIDFSGDPQISHLGPGEKFELHGAATPGPTYQPLSDALSRDAARAIGITYGGLTMNHTGATYSSVRMENSSIWPVVLRRRERVAAPQMQMIFEAFFDEEVGEGLIPLKGGYEAFEANREALLWTQWHGPSKPTADDLKSAKASTERMQNGTSAVEIEAAEQGVDPEELFDMRVRLHRRYVAEGMQSPYAVRNGPQPPGASDKDDTDARPE